MAMTNTARSKLLKHNKADLFMTQLGWQELLIVTKTTSKALSKYIFFLSRKSEITIAGVHVYGQCAKKVVPDSHPGLVDFTIGLVNFEEFE